MKAMRLLGALAALAAAVLAWQVLTTPVDDAVQAAGAPTPSPIQAAPAHVAAAPVPEAKPALLAGQASQAAPAGQAARSIDATLKEGLQSTNYRQYIQQVLGQPSAVGIRVAMELHMMCSLIKQIQGEAASPRPRPLRPPDLELKLQARSKACEQSNGPDWQQWKALSAAKKRSFDAADEFMIHRPFKGTQEELATLYRLGDAGGMATWGLASTPEHLLLVVGDEKVFLQQSSLAAVRVAWQAVVCERFGCDDFNARMVRCRDEASCQMSLQDIFKEASDVDDATWQQLLAAARRRLDALLPG